jgi:iron complex transport system substrate-binding protein
MNVEEISAIVVDSAYHLHVDLGPGLLESVYETVLDRILTERGLKVERQKAVVFEYHGIRFDDGLRVDLLIDGRFVVELKSVENLAPVHGKQLLTYLRLLHLPLGLLINFGAATFKEGCKRIVNDHHDFASSRLRLREKEARAGGTRCEESGTRSREGREGEGRVVKDEHDFASSRLRVREKEARAGGTRSGESGTRSREGREGEGGVVKDEHDFAPSREGKGGAGGRYAMRGEWHAKPRRTRRRGRHDRRP